MFLQLNIIKLYVKKKIYNLFNYYLFNYKKQAILYNCEMHYPHSKIFENYIYI